MKKLFAICSIAFGLLSTSIFAGDPADPLSAADMQCDMSGATFCGDGSPSATYNENSCFERVSVQGCKIIMGPASAFCSWGVIFTHGMQSQSPADLCRNETTWCLKHHYTDCQDITNSCIQYNTQFQNVCKIGRAHV